MQPIFYFSLALCPAVVWQPLLADNSIDYSISRGGKPRDGICQEPRISVCWQGQEIDPPLEANDRNDIRIRHEQPHCH